MQKIGWNKRSKTPGLLIENGWQIGYGMAVGVFGAGKGIASVRAILNSDGNLILETAISDMGPGTTTSMTRIAAEKMQVPLEKIKFKLGDSNLPPGPSQGGSGTTSTVGSAVLLACETVQNKLKELAIKFVPAFANKTATDLLVTNNIVQLVNGDQLKISTSELLKIAEKSNIDITVTSTGKTAQELKFATNSFSVHFVRLAVNPKNGAIKIQQVVATADAGKIINYKTARSQMIGGVVGGVGMAMSEEAKFDIVTGQITNASLNGYHVPLHSEIPQTDVWFVNKPDNNMGELGAKGVGEISLIGVAAAITNALYNATGKRVRSLPITPQKLGFKA
jgi:xanthine dehydrogenase YagR molybdenum-binding subunit